MRISDWSSDVCSSDLSARLRASRSATSYLRPIAAMNAGSIGDGSLRTVGGGPIRSDPCAYGTFRAARESLSGASHSVRASNHRRSEEHTSELQSLMRISYAVFCLKKKNTHIYYTHIN